MITSDGRIILSTGSIIQYSAPSLFVAPTYYPSTGEILLKISVVPNDAQENIVQESLFRTTKTDVDAKTGTGTGDTAKFQNAIEQVAKDLLLALNPSVTFTIV